MSDWRDRRVAAGVSIRELERLSGIHRGTISAIERGQRVPYPSEAERLDRALWQVAARLARETP